MYDDLVILRDHLKKSQDLEKHKKKIKEVERKFTLFNSKIVNEAISNTGLEINLIGFHGQTILHLPNEKICRLSFHTITLLWKKVFFR